MFVCGSHHIYTHIVALRKHEYTHHATINTLPHVVETVSGNQHRLCVLKGYPIHQQYVRSHSRRVQTATARLLAGSKLL